MTSIARFESSENEISSTIDAFFRTFAIGSILRRNGAYKTKGVPALRVFRTLFELVFIHKSLFAALRSGSPMAAAKDAFYRFINSERINWARYTLMLASRLVGKLTRLTSEKRVNVLIVDDTLFERGRSLKVELASRVFDHCKKRYTRGFRLLTLGWSDGNTFVPIESRLLASANAKSRLQEAKELDKRTCGYKRRQIAQGGAPNAMMEMVRAALGSGVNASYVLFDSWFSTSPNILKLKEEMGLDVIAIVKKGNARYRWDGKMLSVKDIYKQNRKRRGRSHYLLSVEVEVESHDGERSTPARLVFVRNRNKKKNYLVLLTTDLSLSEEEIIRLYGKRWSIEVFFKVCKSYLRLTKECHSLSYDAMSAWVSIVLTRYMLLAYLNRIETDDRAAGELFERVCEELADITYLAALQLILKVIADTFHEQFRLAEEELRSMLNAFIAVLPGALRRRLLSGI